MSSSIVKICSDHPAEPRNLYLKKQIALTFQMNLLGHKFLTS